MIYIFWSCRNKPEAKKIVHTLLDAGLIACASILPEIESIYRWEGKLEESLEVKVILKTLPEHFACIQSIIQTMGSYEVPEIVSVDIARVNPSYLEWVVKETSKGDVHSQI